ncbi:transposase [Candidatus Poriferisodalis sp.]|uniref:transposase n=1 Tax=Candidatus Poriferisodalis sp. TaxID=3101277 RepID=UPI003C6F6BB3
MSLMEEQRAGPVLPAGRSRRSFSKDFKADAVALVLEEGRSIASVARSLGIGATNLGNWVRQARVDRGEREGMTTAERGELVELRRENARLRQERELLKRATAFWVKELGQGASPVDGSGG